MGWFLIVVWRKAEKKTRVYYVVSKERVHDVDVIEIKIQNKNEETSRLMLIAGGVYCAKL